MHEQFRKMKKRIILIVICFHAAFPFYGYTQQHKRADSFFGFHFDFHATVADKELGNRFDTLLFSDFLRRTKPDYIQIDSKGHPGYSSYPTKIGYSANSFVNVARLSHKLACGIRLKGGEREIMACMAGQEIWKGLQICCWIINILWRF